MSLDKNLLHQLQELKTLKRAPLEWREQTRERILSVIESAASRQPKFGEVVRLRLAQIRLAVAPVPVVPTFVVLVALLFGSVPGIRAMESSLPGSWLYPVKRTVEGWELSFRTDPKSQGLYYLKLADRRLNELSNITSDKNTQVALLRDYNISLGFAELGLNASVQSPDTVSRYDSAVEMLGGKLTNIKANTDTWQAYSAARLLTDRLSSEAVAVLVRSHQNGELPQAISARLEAQIAKVEAKLDGVDDRLRDLPVVNSVPRVVIESKQAFVPAREAAKQAKQSLTEAKALVQKKEFTLALQKVQEGEDIATKTEAAVDKVDNKDGLTETNDKTVEPTKTEDKGKVDGATDGTKPDTGDTGTIKPVNSNVNVNIDVKTPLSNSNVNSNTNQPKQ